MYSSGSGTNRCYLIMSTSPICSSASRYVQINIYLIVSTKFVYSEIRVPNPPAKITTFIIILILFFQTYIDTLLFVFQLFFQSFEDFYKNLHTT